MEWFKRLFCFHLWKPIKKRVSNHCSDWQTFSDLGYYDDVLYECIKCGKKKVKVVANESHPLHHEWRDINDKN